MTRKSAALLALVGTILMTALLVWPFVPTLFNVVRDLVPAVTLLPVIDLSVRLLQCGSILLRVPSCAAVVIPAKLFSYERLSRVIRQEGDSAGDLAAGRVQVAAAISNGIAGFSGQSVELSQAWCGAYNDAFA